MNEEEILAMIALLERIIEATTRLEEKYADQLAQIHPKFEKSAINLLHYRAFRRFDIRNLQNGLSQLGLSRLGKSEAHLLASLNITKSVLKSFLEPKKIIPQETYLNITQGNQLLPVNTDALLGSKPEKRPVRIMVTQPTETSRNTDLVKEMIQSGMDIARINCAHDAPEIWEKIIDNIRANQNSSRAPRVCMDLGGPKIRTGTIYNGSNVVKYKPLKDGNGKVPNPLRISLVANFSAAPKNVQNCLQLPQDWIEHLEIGDTIKFFDARGKHRKFIVCAQFENRVEVFAHKTCYLKRGMEVSVYKNAKMNTAEIQEVRSPSDKFLALKIGDTITLEKKGSLSKSGVQKAGIIKNARISCTSDSVFDYVRMGERILFDDGKITGKIVGLSPSAMDIKITYAKATGSILREDKGINFPDTDLQISGLTQTDKDNLPFIAKNADVVNLSFVNRKEDVQELIGELSRLPEGDRLGIILKIETKSGFENLTEILLTAMQVYPIGVMIARGDLAVECGWQNMARIQEEILSLCMASHIPVIWATQVLENLAKKGIPSRPEITDAAMSQRAECVMLNKGPHIVQTIEMLDHILADMSRYQYKKSPMFPLWA